MTNRERLQQVMAVYGVNSIEVAKLISRSRSSVLKYMCGEREIKTVLIDALEINAEKAQKEAKEKAACQG